MPDTLLSESIVHLFGSVMKDITVSATDYGGGSLATALKANNTAAVAARGGGRAVAAKALTVARIYAFAFQNEFFELTSPALFLVSGEGDTLGDDPDLSKTGLARIPDKLNPSLSVWTVERDTLTVRLDVMAGSFNRVLLDYELAEGGLQDFVRGGGTLGTPTAVSSRARRRPRGWRSDDE